MNRRFGLAMLAMSLLLLASAGPAWAAGHSVSAVDFRFVPATITIDAGDSITWTNDSTDNPHTVTPDSGGFSDCGNLNPGQSCTRSFSSPETIKYHCTYHQSLGMVGTIVVQGTTQTTAPGSTTIPPTGSPLPNTGASPLTGPFAVLGLLFLVTGGFVLFRLRRRA